MTLAVTEIREYGGSSIQVVRRLRALLEELHESVLQEHREAVEDELARLDATLAEHWKDSVDLDRASSADRQGIGGPRGGYLVTNELPHVSIPGGHVMLVGEWLGRYHSSVADIRCLAFATERFLSTNDSASAWLNAWSGAAQTPRGSPEWVRRVLGKDVSHPERSGDRSGSDHNGGPKLDSADLGREVRVHDSVPPGRFG